MERGERSSLGPVINATGVVIHTNLGRAPLPFEALEAIDNAASGYSNLEYDLERGERGSRQAHVEPLVCELTGAEAALVVNNNAAAVLLALTTLAAGGEVVISRGQLVEIGGSFRIPEILSLSGARLVEVGTTNRTRVTDYERAIGPDTAGLMRVHASNFRTIGFTEEPQLAELIALSRREGLFVIDDLGSGVPALRRDALGALLRDEPAARESIEEGADVVCFSADKLLGGPQAGIVAGRREAIERMRSHPLARALRIDKLSLAALEATLRLHRDPERAARDVPVLQMLARARGARAAGRRLRTRSRRARRGARPAGSGGRGAVGRRIAAAARAEGSSGAVTSATIGADELHAGCVQATRR